MYADDIVSLSKTAKGLLTLLCRLENFCNKWNLKVNINKKKIIIFNKAGRVLKGHNFTYGNILLDHVNEYKYLGIYLGHLVLSHKVSSTFNKALKAIFCIKKALISDCMNTGLYATLYNHCLKHILLYGSEVRSIYFLINKPGLTQMEKRYDLFIPEKKNQLKFLKNVMGTHNYSVNDAVRADFGIFPLAISGFQGSANFWVYLVNSNKSALAYQAYQDSMNCPKGFAQKF